MLRAISKKHPWVHVLWMALGIFFSTVSADLPINVHTATDLSSAATSLANVTSHGTHVINLYGSNNLGQFKLDAPGSVNDTLVFQRPGSPTPLETDSAIEVNGTFLTIKQWKGPVKLIGLSFNLSSAKSILIAGSETGKENGNLILDSCMIYADTLDGPFLNWMTSATSSIDLRRSFFVARNASTLTTMSLTAGTINLFNNLFNYPGTISAVTNVYADIESNTFNRTQVQLSGKLSAGLVPPRYQFNRNLIAHRGPVDALTGWIFADISGYSDPDGVIQYNRIYSTWSAFDQSNSAKFATGTNNLFIDTILNKPMSELWNWYVPGETLVGFSNGASARASPYNIMPDIQIYPFTIDNISAKILFTPSNFPRQISPSFVPDSLPFVENPDLRFLFPTRGSLHFGPFHVTNLTLTLTPTLGKPVLLSRDVTGKFTRQKVQQTDSTAQSSVFVNGLDSARYFAISFLGNTPRGVMITPSLSQLAFPDTLVFKKVDSSGLTQISDNQNHVFPKELRYLGRKIGFTTTASLKDFVLFGTRDSILPYDSSNVFWIQSTSNALIPNQPGGPLGSRWACKIPAAQELMVFLVEKLSVPAGGNAFTLGKGSLKAASINGYQLSLDSSGIPDPGLFGSATPIYKPKWIGRGDSDTLTLTLSGKADQEGFSIQGGSVTSLNYVLQPDSTFQISIPKADSGKGFFAAVRYNVFARTILNKSIDGDSISNFWSSTSGRLHFAVLDKSIGDIQLQNSDKVFVETRFLGGRKFQKKNLNPTSSWDFDFAVTRPENGSKVEVWVTGDSNLTWLPIPPVQIHFTAKDSSVLHVTGIPSDTKWIVAVERLPPLDTVIKLKWDVDTAGRTLSVTPTSNDPLNRLVQRYRLELREVDKSGNIIATTTDSVAIDSTSKVRLLPGSAYVYRIQYYSNQQPYGTPKFIPVPGISWTPGAVMNENDTLRSVNSWQLVGFPVTNKLGDLFQSHNRPVKDTTMRDVTFFLRIKNILAASGRTRIAYDTVSGWDSVRVSPGKAFLFAAAKPYSFVLPDASKFLPLVPDTLTPADTGWQFIANPFPATARLTKITSTKQTTSPFYRLDSSSQSFIPASVIQSFQGYAYHFRPDEKLIFNLLKDVVGSSKQSATPRFLQASLDAMGQSAQMEFSTAMDADVPYLSGLKPYLQMRIGESGGYFVKSVSRPWEIDEPVTIITTQATTGQFHLSAHSGVDALSATGAGTGESPTDPGFASLLINTSTGKTYDQAQAESLPLGTGSSQFRLIAGPTDYVQAKLRAFLASAPQTVGMSQNFPNPFRGLTRIALDWPMTDANDRHAVIEVLDIRGRILKNLVIKDISVGRQLVSVDASAWPPGIYIYRLSVFAGGHRMQMEKRMLVAP